MLKVGKCPTNNKNQRVQGSCYVSKKTSNITTDDIAYYHPGHLIVTRMEHVPNQVLVQTKREKQQFALAHMVTNGTLDGFKPHKWVKLGAETI